MATLPSLKKISDLPTYSNSSPNSGTMLYTESGVDYKLPINTVTLTSDLVSTDSGKGAALVGLEQGSNVQSALRGYINAAAFGYVADYDPTTNTGTDNTIALRAAATYCLQYGIRKLIIPPGMGLISDYIPIDVGTVGEAVADRFKGCQDGFHIQGAGMYSSLLVFDAPDADTPAIKATGDWGTHTARAISDLAIVPRTTAAYNVDTLGQGIQFIGGCFIPIRNVVIGRFHKGICFWNKNKGINDTTNTFTAGDFTEFIRGNNIRIFNCDIGIDFMVTLGNNSFHGINFTQTQVQIRKYGGIGVRFYDDGSRAAIVTPSSNYQFIANVYNAKLDINLFGDDSSTCYGLYLSGAQGRGMSGDITCEGAITLKTNSFEWYQSFGSLHSISAINLEIGATDTSTRPVAFMFSNAAYPQKYFDGSDPTLLSTSYPRQFDGNNHGNTGMDLLNIRGAQSGNIWSQAASNVSVGWIFSTRTTGGSRPAQRTVWQFSYDGTRISSAGTSVGLYNSTVGVDLTAAALVPSGNTILNIGSATYRFNSAYFNGWSIGTGGIVPTADVNVNVGSSTFRVNRSYVASRYYTSTVFDSSGTGSPEGVVAAAIGSTYRRTDGGANTSFYVKESGTGTTGWVSTGSVRPYVSGMFVSPGNLVLSGNYIFKYLGTAADITVAPVPGTLWSMLIPGASVKIKATTTQTTTTGTNTALTWASATTEYNSSSIYTVATAGITVPVAGIYRISGRVAFASNNTGTRSSGVFINGSYYAGSQARFVAKSGGYATTADYNDTLSLAAGSIITLSGFQDSGGNLDTVATAPDVSFLIVSLVSYV